MARTGDRRRNARGGRRSGDRPGKCPTLLVVESHVDLRTLLVQFLDRCNFQVETAGTADEVFSVLRRERPAAVLIDSALPDLSPWQLGAWLMGDRQAPRTPMIVLGREDTERQGGTTEFQPQEVLPKPFELSSLLESVRRALRAAPPP